MTMKRWLLCAGLLAGAGTLFALRGQSQELEGLGGLDEGPSFAQQGPAGAEGALGFGRGPGGPQGSQGPGMMAMRGGRQNGFPPGGPGGMGMRGGPMQDPKLRERIEKEMKLRRQVAELARRCREAGAKDTATAELKQALNELFDAELSNREHRAQKLQEEASRLKEAVSKGRTNKDKLVARRLEQMIDADGLAW